MRPIAPINNYWSQLFKFRGGDDYTGLTQLRQFRDKSYKQALQKLFTQKKEEQKTNITNFKEINKHQTTRNVGTSLTTALATLASEDWNKTDKEVLATKVANFATAYNKLITNTKDSDDAVIANAAGRITKASEARINALQDIGFTVNSDKTLSFDRSKLDTEKAKDLFSDSYGSWSDVIDNYSENIITRTSQLIQQSNYEKKYTESGLLSYDTIMPNFFEFWV